MFTILRFCFVFCAFTVASPSQAQQQIENIIIVTTDGMRWQDVFTGMDSSIANNKNFNQGDSNWIFKKYWTENAQDRRKKLMPFLWNTIAEHGQVYGNRLYNNNVDNANPYWFSYPGYNEIFTGYPDTAINSNEYKPNPNTSFLEFFASRPAFRNKVVAFGAWEAFDRILNEQRAGFPVFSAFDTISGSQLSLRQQQLNSMLKDSYKPFGSGECLDVFTHYMAMDYLTAKSPKLMYISYGETDEWAHSGRYKDYLNAANQVDKWLSDLWSYIQSNEKYRNRTALFITVDHGRGGINKTQWTDHGESIPDAHEIWFAVMGPGIPAKGEIKTPMQLYQAQFAQTISALLGVEFTAEHPIGKKIEAVQEAR